jgi:hypothetical protein
MGVADARRLQQLEDENSKLRRLIADLSLDEAILHTCSDGNLTPNQRRGLVGYQRDAHQVTER